MNFDDVIDDIEKLKGKQLRAIGRGSAIVILGVDRAAQRVELAVVDSGARVTRSFTELRKVWEGLSTNAAVHVDAILAGSGSSRNQPETICASLPYVEYLYINNKKHIALMPSATHEPGTLREMDAIRAQKVKAALRETQERIGPPVAVIVVVDIRVGVAALEALCGLSVEPVIGSPGKYRLYKGGYRLVIVEKRHLLIELPEGTYAVVASRLPQGRPVGIQMDGYSLLLPPEGPLRALVAAADA